MIAEQRIWLSADGGSAVPEGDPQAAFLIAAEGSEIPEEYEEIARNVKASSASSNKQSQPAKNKVRGTADDKGDES